MEDPNDNNSHYTIADLRQLINGAATAAVTRSPHHFPPPISPPPELFSGHRNYEMMMVGTSRQVGVGFHDLCADSSAAAEVVANNNNNNLASCSAPSMAAAAVMEGEIGGSLGGDGGTGRWPRQETLTLLEIRSRLDSKFKEANQKGPLWDEVSRIMSEEHGYQRSGKKCREKFENLYKYYKKTKEGKAGRQDGKHYRFFRQLEALYGDHNNTSNNNNNNSIISSATTIPETQFNNNTNGLQFQNASISNNTSNNTSGFNDTSSSDNDNDNDLSNAAGVKDQTDQPDKRRKRRGSKNWKAKIKEFIDSQMRKLVEKQEVWLEKIMKTLEQKEQERMKREEEWRREDRERLEREYRFWAKEREWIESRDAALMDALQKLSGKSSSSSEMMKSPTSSKERNKKRKEDNNNNNTSRSCCYNIQTDHSCLYNDQGTVYGDIGTDHHQQGVVEKAIRVHHQTNDDHHNNHGSSPSSSNAGNASAMTDSCLRFLMGEGENFWENYGLKLNQGENQ